MKTILLCSLLFLSLTSCTSFIIGTGRIDPYYADCRVKVVQSAPPTHRLYWPAWRNPFRPYSPYQYSGYRPVYNTHHYGGHNSTGHHNGGIIGGRRK